MWGTEVMHWGEAATSWENTPQHTYIRSSLEWDIGHGEGAAAWGYGKVRSADWTMNEVTSDNIFPLTLEDPGTIASVEADETGVWVPGMHNFVGENGLLYGVPYTDAEGKTVMPDMGRVEATNGTIGYMAVDSIETAVFNGAASPSEQIEAAKQNAIDEAKAFRSAFAEYYGVDALSDAAAYQCIIDVRYEGGVEGAIFAIEQDTKDFMLEVIRGDVAVFSGGENDAVSNHLESLTGSSPSGEYMTSEEAFEEILDIAKQSMVVSVPVYSIEGDVIGEYSFVRF